MFIRLARSLGIINAVGRPGEGLNLSFLSYLLLLFAS